MLTLAGGDECDKIESLTFTTVQMHEISVEYPSTGMAGSVFEKMKVNSICNLR